MSIYRDAGDLSCRGRLKLVAKKLSFLMSGSITLCDLNTGWRQIDLSRVSTRDVRLIHVETQLRVGILQFRPGEEMRKILLMRNSPGVDSGKYLVVHGGSWQDGMDMCKKFHELIATSLALAYEG